MTREERLVVKIVTARRVLACMSSPFPDFIEAQKMAGQKAYIAELEKQLEELKKSRP